MEMQGGTGRARGKAERQFLTFKQTWLYALDLDSIKSLAQFNGMLADYMRSYNTSFHSGIGGIPFERYRASCSGARPVKSREWLDECFLPDDMSTAYILYDGGRYPIRMTNHNENCRAKRQDGPSIDYSKLGGTL